MNTEDRTVRCCCSTVNLKTCTIVLAVVWLFLCALESVYLRITYTVSIYFSGVISSMLNLIFFILLIVGIKRRIPGAVLATFVFIIIQEIYLAVITIITFVALVEICFVFDDVQDPAIVVIRPIISIIGSIINMIVCAWLLVLIFRCHRLLVTEKMNRIIRPVCNQFPAQTPYQVPFSQAVQPGYIMSYMPAVTQPTPMNIANFSAQPTYPVSSQPTADQAKSAYPTLPYPTQPNSDEELRQSSHLKNTSS